ncbi:MAG: DciA family protein [Candidatus Contendobacter sp.]
MTVADADARATARRHTAPLLKMLRGYGPSSATSEPEPVPDPPVAVPKPDAVAEATPIYDRWVDEVPSRSSPLPVLQPSPPPLPPRPRVEPGSIPTVGETLCRPRGVLGQIMARAGRLNRLSEIFHAYLPPHLRDHTVLIRLDSESWEVQTDSASWATRLRYALPTIRQALGQQLGIPLPKPRIRVAPAAAPPKPRRPRLTLTQRNAELLEAAARTLADPRLGAALRQLAAHGQPGSGSKA